MAKRVETKYDNFWSNLWKNSGYTSRELADKLGVSQSAFRNWFTGRYMPSKESAELVCRLFDVDYAKGMSEFRLAHKTYVENMVGACSDTAGEENPVCDVKEDVKDDQVFDKVLRLLYKKVDYNTFMIVANALRG